MSSKENFDCRCNSQHKRVGKTYTTTGNIPYQKESFDCACDYYSKEEMAYTNPTPGGRYIIDTCCKSSEKFFNQDRNVEGFTKL
jgi:hypothetical protein